MGSAITGRRLAVSVAGALLCALAPFAFYYLSTFMPGPAAGTLAFLLSFALAAMLLIGLREKPSEEIECRVEPDPLTPMIFKASNEAILITDSSARILDVNPAFTEITGYTKEEVLGKNPGMMKSGKHDSEFYAEMWKSLRESGNWRGEIWDRNKDGEVFAKWLAINTVNGPSGEVEKYIGIFSDITALKETEQYHEFLAHYDSLTRLPNRLLFNDRLERAMLSSMRHNLSMALMFLDLDNFKNVNDTLGHHAGDRLLQAVAGRVKDAVRRNDTVARLGGDEFAVIVPEVRTPNDAAAVAEKIIRSMTEPFKVGPHDLLSSASIGITMFPEDSDSKESLLRNADIAMYHAKDQGRGIYQFFTQKMKERVEERIRVEHNLRDALTKGEMVLYYQPQVDLRSGRIIGVEALIRRQEEEWLVPPAIFMGVAEETGLVVDICNWTLDESCRLAMQWFSSGVPLVRMAVNVSALQFEMVDFVDRVSQSLINSGLDPALLELELTERVLMKNTETAVKKMNRLKEMGVMLSIDDFGTGYSSMNYLRTFPVEKLKIDYSFVHAIGKGKDGEAIVRSIISLAHNLDMTVIAEGVEKKEQLDFLRAEGCDEIQGFYFSFPLPAENCEKVLREGKNLDSIEP
jgi:diguanylate cyclase (GGDEF)-like protein/PAS domain S-box-containing protein